MGPLTEQMGNFPPEMEHVLEVKTLLEEVILRFGLLKSLQSDNGPSFIDHSVSDQGPRN